jgi:hypothetical protein
MLRGSAGSHGGRKRRTEYPLAGGKKENCPVGLCAHGGELVAGGWKEEEGVLG